MGSVQRGEAQDRGQGGVITLRLPPRSLRRDLDDLRQAALDAVDPAAAVARYLQRDGDELRIAGHPSVGAFDRVIVCAAGKAAAPMAAAAAEILGADLVSQQRLSGVIVTKVGHAAGTTLPPALRVMEAGHPIPDASGQRAGEAVIDLLGSATARDLVLVLLSGGASALLPAPAPGLTLEDLQATTDQLLRAGATIVELNTVRKHLSQLKGGQMARLAAPARVIVLILSDVVGDPLDVIASGPTAPDPTTYADALAVLRRHQLLSRVPSSVLDTLQAGAHGHREETPKPGDAIFDTITHVLVGSNRLAAEAAVARARELGYNSLLLTTFVEGEAREVAKVAVALAKGVRSMGIRYALRHAWSGEGRLRLPSTVPAKGGETRNWHFRPRWVLMGCLELRSWPSPPMAPTARPMQPVPWSMVTRCVARRLRDWTRTPHWLPTIRIPCWTAPETCSGLALRVPTSTTC